MAKCDTPKTIHESKCQYFGFPYKVLELKIDDQRIIVFEPLKNIKVDNCIKSFKKD